MTSDERVKYLKRIGRARWHVQVDHGHIARLKEMIKQHRAESRDPKPAEELLSVFERSQMLFERYLAELERQTH